MALPVSSLSVALQGFADHLDGQFGQEVIVSLDTPHKAQDLARGSDKQVLNVFAYRLAPSGFHSEAGMQEALFLRAHVLLTCFPAGQGDPAPDTDLRVLGHAMAVLQSAPVIPLVLPGPLPAGAPDEDFRNRPHTIYRMQAVPQTPGMEELNHIWTTQGGDLAYRLSVAYELALIPVEPLSHRAPSAPVRAGIVDVTPAPVPVLAPDGLTAFGAEAQGRAFAGDLPGTPAPVDWVPISLFALPSGMATTREIAPGTAQVEIALAGPPGARAALSVRWTRAAGGEEGQAPQAATIAAQRIDDPAARLSVALASPLAGDLATIQVRPADAGGAPLAGAPPGNVLTLSVGHDR